MWRRLRPASSRTSWIAASHVASAKNASSRVGWASDASSTSRSSSSARIVRRSSDPLGAATDRRRVRGSISGRERGEPRRAASSTVVEREVHAAVADAALELRRRALGHGAAAVEHDDPVREPVGLLEVLGGEDERGAVGHQIGDRAPHVGPGGGVQPGGGLVEEHDRAAHDQARGEVQPPPHPAAVGEQQAIGGVGQAEALEQLARARHGLALATAVAAGRAASGSRGR